MYLQYSQTLPEVEEDTDKAITQFDRYLSLKPANSAIPHFIVGRLYRKQKKIEDAKQHLSRAALKHPEAMYEYATLLEETGADEQLYEVWYQNAANNRQPDALIRLVQNNVKNLYDIPVAKQWATQLQTIQSQYLPQSSVDFINSVQHFIAEHEREHLAKFEEVHKLGAAQRKSNQLSSALVSFEEAATLGYPSSIIELIKYHLSTNNFEAAHKWAIKGQTLLKDEKWCRYWFPSPEDPNLKTLQSASGAVQKRKQAYEAEWFQKKMLLGVGVAAAGVVALFLYSKKDD